MVTESMVRTMLLDVFDPEMGVSIVDLGLVYKVNVKDDKIIVEMTLTSPGCPQAPELISEVKKVLKGINGINEVDVDIVWTPPWKPEMMSDEAREILSGYYSAFKIEP